MLLKMILDHMFIMTTLTIEQLKALAAYLNERIAEIESKQSK